MDASRLIISFDTSTVQSVVRIGVDETNSVCSSPANEPSKRNKNKKNKKSNTAAPVVPPPPAASPPRPIPVATTTAASTSAAPTQFRGQQGTLQRAAEWLVSARRSGLFPLIPPPVTGNQPPSTRAASKQPLSNYGMGHRRQGTPPSSNSTTSGKHRQPVSGGVAGSNNSTENASKIWSTVSLEERERIKEFWLSLEHQERRDFVKFEKEAILKKLKEQQKHSCSCTVCGRRQ